MNKWTSRILVTAVASTLLLGGCATTLDPNYAAQLEVHSAQTKAAGNAEMARAQAEAARFAAIAKVAEGGDARSKDVAIMALALSGANNGGGGGNASAMAFARNVPQLPESDADKAYKWTALFAGPITNIASGYFGYKLGTTQSNNSASVALSTNDTFGKMSNYAMTAATNISNSGFNAVTNTATSGFNALTLQSQALANQAPNITVNGNGNGFNTGAGTNNNTYTNRNCITGNSGNGAAGASGGNGGGAGGSPGGNGAQGGQGGSQGGINC